LTQHKPVPEIIDGVPHPNLCSASGDSISERQNRIAGVDDALSSMARSMRNGFTADARGVDAVRCAAESLPHYAVRNPKQPIPNCPRPPERREARQPGLCVAEKLRRHVTAYFVDFSEPRLPADALRRLRLWA
jgi:hypothetical protein